jgi:Fe-S cluster assembly protein SufD
MTTDVMDDKDLYLAHFSRLEKANPQAARSWLHPLRTAAIERFAELGFPGPHDEDWRFTPLGRVTEPVFQLAKTPLPKSLRPGQADPWADSLEAAATVVVLDGRCAATLHRDGALPAGVVCGSLDQLLNSQRSRIEPHLAHLAHFEDRPFTALNTALFRDGALVYVPRGTLLERPLHLIYVGQGGAEPTVAFPRTLIVCEENTQVPIIQSYLSKDAGTVFTNAVTEIFLGPGARVSHCKVQRESPDALHLEALHVRLQRGSNFHSTAVTLGGSWVRNEINAHLADEACEATLNGLYVGTGTQHVDIRTFIDHAKPNCQSHELYKGILGGKAHGVFTGKIIVRQDAQKTDAKQTNKTLLLSDDATINTKPQLEIFADDVKCTHGATVGQLAGEALFYARSRGIGVREARALLTFAFANDLLQHIQVEPLRRRLEEHFLAAQHLPKESLEEAP